MEDGSVRYKPDAEKVKCDVCKYEYTYEGFNRFQGIDIIAGTDHPEYQRLLDTFGKTNFKICLTCWLKSMGVKPVK